MCDIDNRWHLGFYRCPNLPDGVSKYVKGKKVDEWNTSQYSTSNFLDTARGAQMRQGSRQRKGKMEVAASKEVNNKQLIPIKVR